MTTSHSKTMVYRWGYPPQSAKHETKEGWNGVVCAATRAHELKQTCETPLALVVMSLVFGVHPRVQLRKVRSSH